MLWRLVKLLFWLALLAGLAMVAYAYLGPIVTPADFEPPVRQVTQPITLPTR
ncbi:MAG: hypothetical protein ACU0BF_12335 [Paracoccaceae bacterium]